MVRCMDVRNKKKKQGKGGVEEKRGVDTGAEVGAGVGDSEKRQDQVGKGGWKIWLGYYHLLPLLPLALRRHNHIAQHIDQLGLSEISEQQKTMSTTTWTWLGQIAFVYSITMVIYAFLHLSSPTATATARTRTWFLPSILWPKRKPSPQRHRTELPEDCFGPAAISDCENLAPTGRRLGHGSQQREADGLCELTTEVPKFHSGTSHLSHDCASGVLGLEVDGIIDIEEEKGRKETLAEKGPPYYTSNGDGNDQDEYDSRKTTSSCPSRESGPLGNLEVLEKGMDSEGSPGRWL
ncbi:hypothetical protein QBC45DRAFT_401091 [Copromyces sp. CBS 386.78]|nr:hypothetical protein QBC45DRAFT_401091 [Copromyces sp. CBS 386.78]